jgi:hypothetical protein
MFFAHVFLMTALVAQAPPVPSPTPTASPSPAATAAPPNVITAPKDWKRLPMSPHSALLTGLGLWTSPAKTETLNVISGSNIGMSAEQVGAILVQRLRARQPSLVLSVNRAATLCRGTSGWTIEYRNASGSTEIRHVIGVTPTRQYIATYERLTNIKDSAGAIAALQSLCPPAGDSSTASSMNSLGRPPLEPPAGWTAGTTAGLASAASSPPMWLWFAPISKGSTQLVVAMSVTTPTSQGTDDQALAAVRSVFEAKVGPLQIADRHQVTLCSVTQGTFFRMIGTQNTPITIEFVISTGVPTSYVAMYMHPTAVPAASEAEASIQSLCPADRQSAG